MFFQAEDGIRDLVRSRGLGDVYKRQGGWKASARRKPAKCTKKQPRTQPNGLSNTKSDRGKVAQGRDCLLYTSDAADERSSVDLGGRRIIKKKNEKKKKNTYKTNETTPVDDTVDYQTT